MAQYSSVKTNTLVSVTNGSSVVTGDTTKWVGAISPGDAFTVAGTSVLYDVASVDSDTQITLTAPYGGDTAASAHYTIHRDFTVPDNIPELNNGDIETGTIMKRLAKTIQKRVGQLSGLIFDGYWTIGENYVNGSVVIHTDATTLKVFVANKATTSEPPSVDWDVLFDGITLNVSNVTPQPLGTASPGTSPDVSRADHVHKMPTPAEIGALTSSATTADVPESGTYRYYTEERESQMMNFIISVYDIGYVGQTLHLDFTTQGYAVFDA